MRRVVVTGLGIVSSIGSNKTEVLDALRYGKTGICFNEEQSDMGFRSQVVGAIHLDLDALIDRKIRRFMGDGAAFNYLAMQEAIMDSGLNDKEISNPKTGLVVGSGGPSTSNLLLAWDTYRDKGVKKVGP